MSVDVKIKYKWRFA